MNIVNTYHHGASQDQRHYLLTVLTQGGSPWGGDAAAYEAVVELPMEPEADYQERREAAARWTAAHGQKLTYQQAVLRFPSLTEEGYRR